ncbi:MAG: 50S ribosomal protein L25 [Bacteroidota bacterium]
MAEITLKAKIRDYKGRTASNAARRDGKVPGVFYLGNEKNLSIEVEALDLRHLVYTSETHIVDLQLSDGSSEAAVLRDVQFDPVTDRMVHFDLIGVVRGQKMKFEVPVILEGSCEGVRLGGILQQVLHKLEVECTPKNLPEHIGVDITDLQIGTSLLVSDLKLENVEIITNGDQSIAILSHPRAEAAAGETEDKDGTPALVGSEKGGDE